MWYEDVTNELYEAGINDDKLALLAKINESNDIAVKTPVGLTSRKNIKKIICQGDPWGSIDCSLMVDGFGKESLKEDLDPYKYKGQVPIPLLGMVDDIFIISESGHKSQRLNGFINAKTAVKRLQFGAQKCHVMHIGKNIPDHKKMEFYVDNWKMKEVDSTTTNSKEEKDIFDGEEDIKEIDCTKYLGQIISKDGTNVKNIVNRANKGIGLVNKINTTLQNTPGGRYHFELSVVMRNAVLISSIISCSEVWYRITEWEYRKLEQIDEMLLRKIFDCSSQILLEMLYLELGLMPIRFIIMLRRIIYLQHILKQKHKQTLLFRFFKAQIENPNKNDWVSSVVQDLCSAKIDLELIEIENMTEERYKTLCKQKVKTLAFEYLMEKKSNRQNRTKLNYDSLNMAKYLQADEFNFTIQEKQNLFKCRMNDIDVKANRTWKYDNLNCMACNEPNQIETQEHVLCCKSLTEKNSQISYIPSYNDLFNDETEKQIYTSRILCENLKISRAPM